MPLLKFNMVSKVYTHQRSVFLSPKNKDGSSIRALAEVSLSISKGQSVGVIGESGAGKSTLAAIAVGLIAPSSGSVFIDGQSQAAAGWDRLQRARKVQLVWQDANGSVDPRQSVAQMIREPLQMHRKGDKNNREQRIGELLDEVGLSPGLASRKPHELSGGELQRVVIARALAVDPEMLICDEPAAALDARTKSKVANLLLSLQRERKLALMVIAHDLSLINRITGELIVMHRGAIVEQGRTDKVVNCPSHAYTRQLISSDPSWSKA